MGDVIFGLTMSDIIVGVISTAVVSLFLFIVARSWSRVRRAAIAQHTLAQLGFGRRMVKAGVSNFYVGRDEWLRFRRPPKLGDYLRRAKSSVRIACYWLAQGSLEGVQRVYAELAERGVLVEVVMIDPRGPLPQVLAKDVETSADDIRRNVETALRGLEVLRASLSEPARQRLRIGVSSTLPQAAVILIDAGLPSSVLQLEFRPYRAPRIGSFSLEFGRSGGGPLHMALVESWMSYFHDADYAGFPISPLPQQSTGGPSAVVTP